VADQQSNETIRQMMDGFSSMQFNLGLLPMRQAQAMAGAAAPFQAPPPPPQVPHPSEAAAAAMQHQQAMMSQSLQMAQATRYAPPPSAPTPALSAMGAYAPASPVGGGGFMGGGMGGYGGMGGGVAGFSGGGFAPAARAMPSIFNPLAPALPGAHFMSPALQHLQVQQHHQSQFMGAAVGIGSAGVGFGGSMLGGALGSAFGPLGTMAGSWLGGQIGNAVSSMIFNPVTADFARGRQIQQMTSPFMVSGPSMNMATGQGLSAQAGRDVATGIRHLSRDYDFERTGFNTQDAMKIMQSSASAGLLTGAQSSDQIVQKVKDISKTVKMLAQLTGDPDVQHAVQALGQMRSLGFQGLAAQAGAVNNRAVYARMAGQSQAQMTATMMGGADMAGQFGLVGATGATAAMYGAGSANVAASSGALNDLQLARAGGVQGLGRLNTAGALSAVNNEQYLLAAMGRDKQGKFTVDMDEYRRLKDLSFGEVQRRAADAIQGMGAKGIFEWNSQKQELKDRISQQMRPGEAQMMMRSQALQTMRAVPGMDMATAISKNTGMSASDAQSVSEELSSRKYWDGMIQQAEVQKRETIDRQRAQNAQYRTPGLMGQLGRSARGFVGGVSDAISSPFRSLSERIERAGEDEDAASHGQHIRRVSGLAIARDDAERSMSHIDREFLQAYSQNVGASVFSPKPVTAQSMYASMFRGEASRSEYGGGSNRMDNRIGSLLGLTAESDENRVVSLASRAEGSMYGWHPFASFGDVGDAVEKVRNVERAAYSIQQAGSISTQDTRDVIGRLGRGGGGGGSEKFDKFAAALAAHVHSLEAGAAPAAPDGVDPDSYAGRQGRAMLGMFTRARSASALTADKMRQIYIDQQPGNEKAAAAEYDADPKLAQAALKRVMQTGGTKTQEVLGLTSDIGIDAGGIKGGRSRKGADALIGSEIVDAGMVGVAGLGQMGELKSFFAHHDDNDEVAIAAAMAASQSDDADVAKQGSEQLAAIRKRLGEAKYTEKSTSVAGDLTPSSARALTTFAMGGKDITSRIGTGRKAFGNIQGKADMGAVMEKVRALGGEEGDDVVTSLKSVTGSRLDAEDDPTLAKLFRAAQTGDADAIDALAKHLAPTSTEARYGGAASGTKQLDADIAKMKEARDQLSDDSSAGGSQAKGMLDATAAFTDAVKLFAKAAGVVADRGDQAELDKANPAEWASRVWGYQLPKDKS